MKINKIIILMLAILFLASCQNAKVQEQTTEAMSLAPTKTAPPMIAHQRDFLASSILVSLP